MSRCKLNELCQKAGWGTPNYSCVKQGQDHVPLFKASVEVNGSTFQSSALFQSSKAAKDDVAAVAFSHYSTVVSLEMKKKLKLPTMGSCSNKDKGALKEETATPPDLAALTIDEEPDMNNSAESYLLCDKVRVYTSIPRDVVLPRGHVVLPIGEGKWTIASLE